MNASSTPSPRSDPRGEALGDRRRLPLALPISPRFVSQPPRLEPDLVITLAERRLRLERHHPDFERERLRTKTAAPFVLRGVHAGAR